MTTINFDNKKFASIGNSANGEVSPETIFHYRQEGNAIWATNKGDKIVLSTLLGTIDGDKIALIYQHNNQEGQFLTGCWDNQISVRNGKILLNEKWRWSCNDFSNGTSLLEEIRIGVWK